MRSFAAIALDWLHQICLALWLGGTAVLGAVVAPAVFGSAKQAGDTHWGTPLYNFAAEAMGEAFRRFNWLVLGASLVMLGAGVAYGLLSGLDRSRVGLRAGLTAVGGCVAAWLTFGLFPAMIDARTAGRMDAFDGMHHLYSNAFSVQLLLLLAVAVVTASLHHRRGARETEPSTPRRPTVPAPVTEP